MKPSIDVPEKISGTNPLVNVLPIPRVIRAVLKLIFITDNSHKTYIFAFLDI